MSKLLCNRWLRWSLFVGVLVALGIGIYRIQSPEPMCEIAGNEIWPQKFADNGRRLITYAPRGDRTALAPLQVWDTSTGAEIARYLENEPVIVFPTFSRDGRYFAAETIDGMVRGPNDGKAIVSELLLVDVIEGTTRRSPMPGDPATPAEFRGRTETGPKFSTDGTIVTRLAVVEPKGLRIYASKSGHLLDILGDTRFSNHCSNNGEVLLHHVPSKSEKTAAVGVWSQRDHKPMATLDGLGPMGVLSPDSRFYVAEHGPYDSRLGKWAVWNVRTGRIETEFKSAATTPTTGDGRRLKWPIVSHDGKWFAALCRDKTGAYVELCDLATGKQVGKTSTADLDAMAFSPDDRFLILREAIPRNGGPVWVFASPWVMLEVPTMKTLWKQTFTPYAEGFPFSADSRTLFVIAEPPALVACDCETGNVRILFDKGWNPPWLTPDRRRLLARQADNPGAAAMTGWKAWWDWLRRKMHRPEPRYDIVSIVDTDTCRERFRLQGMGAFSALLSDDGRMLATTHVERGRTFVRCWDVDACKPLRWAVGVPTGLGAIGVLFVWWRKRRNPG